MFFGGFIYNSEVGKFDISSSSSIISRLQKEIISLKVEVRTPELQGTDYKAR